ncbi:hypothetical protein DW030_20590 [Parabacteroides merdae]|uniref:Uncharacterized protein n=1 Tax=Parabacteroides merdae TaxID=46503 RepID=A0A3E4ZJL4_9BACT|nr:hypothetical protein DXB85_16585 [Parabacteroides merdae]RHC83228.1 hypothetical protein DW828_12805 [Parabacteroides merdae]RHL22251.1 hypothetical protein DW030_20590 [Parabacteroides merdae]RHM06048.1 hypothetical protein DWZ81_19040 [Parabacteroides merdae]
MKQHKVLDHKEVSFITKPEPQIIKQNIANTKQLILEITDCCNLDCHCYLCPSPSNYEIVIGRLNLCHIK